MDQNASAVKKASDEVKLPGLRLSREEYEALKMEIFRFETRDQTKPSGKEGDINLPGI